MAEREASLFLFFFPNRLGCLGSLLVSAAVTWRLGQPAVPPSTLPVHLGEQLLAAAAGPPASAEAVRREVLAADESLRLLRLLLSPNLEGDIGVADGLALRPLEWIP